ncbi:hypothetical protein EDD11_001050 [Mortierella claussenii]|nr:hypothetical protein EDD11_001050 [Mortierella claussenii]
MIPVFAQLLKLCQVLAWNHSNSPLELAEFDEYCPANIYINMIIAPYKNLQSSGLQQVTIRADQCNFAKIFPKSYVGSLDGIEAPVKRAAEDE